MSHSQFRRVETYTETCMAKSLRQAYDYWQDQPGFFKSRASVTMRGIQIGAANARRLHKRVWRRYLYFRSCTPYAVCRKSEQASAGSCWRLGGRLKNCREASLWSP